jgi:hypothetical protein
MAYQRGGKCDNPNMRMFGDGDTGLHMGPHMQARYMHTGGE